MRRFLPFLLVISFLLPVSAIAKEDAKNEKKPTTSNSQNSNSQKKQELPAPANTSKNSNSEANNSSSSANSGKPEKETEKGKPAENPSTNKDVSKNESKNESKVENKNDKDNNGKKKDFGLEEGQTKEFLVKFRDDASVASEATALRGQKAKVKRTFNNVFKGLSATLNLKQLEALQKNPKVELIEEDAAVSTTDTQLNATWGIDRIDQRALPLNGQYSYTSTGSTVRAYVVDTGVRSTHQEFSGRVQAGFSAIADGLGAADCNGHGTHVAGTIAGTSYGVAKAVSIVPVRVLGCDGSGTLSGVIAGLDWIAANHPSGTPGVANMSLGAGASSTLDSAVNNLINRGVAVVVAAGNSAASACNYSPARVPAAITVAASTINDQLASFSNHGSCVDIIAPGSSITSAWYTSDGAIASLNGTSMASPHVAGAAATLFANGYLSPANVDSQLKAIATSNLFSSLPAGTPNILLYTNSEGAVVTPPPTLSLPSAPSNLVAEAAKRSAQLTWQLAESDGGAPITSQIITVLSGGKTIKTVTTSGTATAATIRSLNTRLSYTFTVSAINSLGQGPASSPSNAITPLR